MKVWVEVWVEGLTLEGRLEGKQMLESRTRGRERRTCFCLVTIFAGSVAQSQLKRKHCIL